MGVTILQLTGRHRSYFQPSIFSRYTASRPSIKKASVRSFEFLLGSHLNVNLWSKRAVPFMLQNSKAELKTSEARRHEICLLKFQMVAAPFWNASNRATGFQFS